MKRWRVYRGQLMVGYVWAGDRRHAAAKAYQKFFKTGLRVEPVLPHEQPRASLAFQPYPIESRDSRDE